MCGYTFLVTVAVICLYLVCAPVGASTWTVFVDDDATGANNGSSWANAYKYLQDALAEVQWYSDAEVRVAQGTYTPDRGAGIAPGDRKASLQLKQGIWIRGGYAGYGKANPNAHDPSVYKSILSGDLKGNDGPGFVNYADNSFHVVTANDTDSRAILDGLSIVSGNANGKAYPDYLGGGLYARTGSPTLANCTFVGNCAVAGGGLHIENGGPTVRNCIFKGNAATGNDSTGGGLCIWEGKPILANCRFVRNSATGAGKGALFGGIALAGYPCQARLVNCLFSGNSCQDPSESSGSGGGLAIAWAKVDLTNCTFADNRAQQGGAIYATDSILTLANCILWGDSADSGPEVAIDVRSVLDINYCCLAGGYGDIDSDETSSITWGFGIIDEDPKFRDSDGLDGVRGTEDDDLRVRIDSACIDAGNNQAVPPDDEAGDTDGTWSNLPSDPVVLDLDGRLRFLDEPSVADSGNGAPPVVDIGAYEYQRGVCGDVSHPYPSGDLDHDCHVGFRDIVILADNWLVCSAPECGERL